MGLLNHLLKLHDAMDTNLKRQNTVRPLGTEMKESTLRVESSPHPTINHSSERTNFLESCEDLSPHLNPELIHLSEYLPLPYNGGVSPQFTGHPPSQACNVGNIGRLSYTSTESSYETVTGLPKLSPREKKNHSFFNRLKNKMSRKKWQSTNYTSDGPVSKQVLREEKESIYMAYDASAPEWEYESFYNPDFQHNNRYASAALKTNEKLPDEGAASSETNPLSCDTGVPQSMKDEDVVDPPQNLEPAPIAELPEPKFAPKSPFSSSDPFIDQMLKIQQRMEEGHRIALETYKELQKDKTLQFCVVDSKISKTRALNSQHNLFQNQLQMAKSRLRNVGFPPEPILRECATSNLRLESQLRLLAPTQFLPSNRNKLIDYFSLCLDSLNTGTLMYATAKIIGDVVKHYAFGGILPGRFEIVGAIIHAVFTAGCFGLYRLYKKFRPQQTIVTEQNEVKYNRPPMTTVSNLVTELRQAPALPTLSVIERINNHIYGETLSFKIRKNAIFESKEDLRPPRQKSARMHENGVLLSLVDITQGAVTSSVLVLSDLLSEVVAHTTLLETQEAIPQISVMIKNNSAYNIPAEIATLTNIGTSLMANILHRKSRLQLEKANLAPNINF